MGLTVTLCQRAARCIDPLALPLSRPGLLAVGYRLTGSERSASPIRGAVRRAHESHEQIYKVRCA